MKLSLQLLSLIFLSLACFGEAGPNEYVSNEFNKALLTKPLKDFKTRFIAGTSVNTEGMRLFETDQTFAIFTKTEQKFKNREAAIGKISRQLGEDFPEEFFYIELSHEIIHNGKLYTLTSAYVVLDEENRITHCHPLDYFINDL